MYINKKKAKMYISKERNGRENMAKGLTKLMINEDVTRNEDLSEGLLWAWKNQPPVMRWWFALSSISVFAVYLLLMVKL